VRWEHGRRILVGKWGVAAERGAVPAAPLAPSGRDLKETEKPTN